MQEKVFTGDKDMDNILQECFKVLVSKGNDYTIGSQDRLHNFRTVAEMTGLSMEKVFSVYFYKHVSSLFSYVKSGGQSESEPIESRIVDCINYLLLFSKIVAEHKSNL